MTGQSELNLSETVLIKTNIEKNTSKAKRCLFGPPDTEATNTFFKNVQDEERNYFIKKYLIDINSNECVNTQLKDNDNTIVYSIPFGYKLFFKPFYHKEPNY